VHCRYRDADSGGEQVIRHAEGDIVTAYYGQAARAPPIHEMQ
jgi:hypothetical protein